MCQKLKLLQLFEVLPAPVAGLLTSDVATDLQRMRMAVEVSEGRKEGTLWQKTLLSVTCRVRFISEAATGKTMEPRREQCLRYVFKSFYIKCTTLFGSKMHLGGPRIFRGTPRPGARKAVPRRDFPKIRVPYFGVLMIRILLFWVLY